MHDHMRKQIAVIMQTALRSSFDTYVQNMKPLTSYSPKLPGAPTTRRSGFLICRRQGPFSGGGGGSRMRAGRDNVGFWHRLY